MPVRLPVEWAAGFPWIQWPTSVEYAAEFEAELIRERTKAGLTAARARGRVGGRPRKVTLATLKMAMAALADPQSNANDVARRLGITRTTLYTYVNGDGSVKEAGQRLLEMEQTSATQKTRKTAELVDTVQST
jgi:DNA invertase Pin-like site-specific DNA recombinase